MSSHCVTQDDPPLHGMYKGTPITLYPRGIFNELSFGAAGVSLRRLYIQGPGSPCEAELDRIADHLLEQYPQLDVFLRGQDNPPISSIRLSSELQKEKTFSGSFHKQTVSFIF